MGATPDRSKLREVADEFELRAVIQRLEDEWDEVGPRAHGRGDDRGRGGGGDARPTSPTGPISLAIGGGRWAASDGERVVVGDAPTSPRSRDAASRAGRCVAHDAKSLGGHGPRRACSRPLGRQGLDLAHDTMVAAYLIDPARRTYDLHELAADEGLSAAAPREAPRTGQLSLAAEEGDAAGDPAVEARLVWELAERQRARLAEFGLERLLDEVEMPLIEVLAGMERDRAQARHRAARRDLRRDGRSRSRRCRPRSTSSPGASSRSARRSSSARCSSTSSG